MISFAANRERKGLKILIYPFLVLAIMIMLSSIVKAEDAVSGGRYTVVVQDNYGTEVYTTEADTVAEFFEEQNITLGELDILKCNLNDKLSQGMVINVKRAEDVSFLIDGEDVYTINMNVNTIGEALLKLKEETGVNYALGEGFSSSQSYDIVDLIPVVSGYTKVETKVIECYFDTETVENPDLEEGTTNVLCEGSVGSSEVVIRVNYENGAAVSTEILSENVIVAPVNKVIEIGTKQPEPEPVREASGYGTVVGSLVMNSSAYSIDYACTGKSPGMAGYGITASGMKAGYGVVAVDPRVIPLGTRLYVEGYGYCIAGDTGGAIKGNKIDLCFNSYSEAVNYGRKNVNVYILA